jgi:hypothetical protein
MVKFVCIVVLDADRGVFANYVVVGNAKLPVQDIFGVIAGALIHRLYIVMAG